MQPKQLRFTERARITIRALPNRHVGQKLREIIDRIAMDPVGMTKKVRLLQRINDGTVLAAGNFYYYQIAYTHVSTSPFVTIDVVKASDDRGPH